MTTTEPVSMISYTAQNTPKAPPVRVILENEVVPDDTSAIDVCNFTYVKWISDKMCIDIVTNLVNLNWNTDLIGVGRDALGLHHKHINIRIDNKPLWSDYLCAYSKSLSRYRLPEELKKSPIVTDSAQSSDVDDQHPIVLAQNPL